MYVDCEADTIEQFSPGPPAFKLTISAEVSNKTIISRERLRRLDWEKETKYFHVSVSRYFSLKFRELLELILAIVDNWK